jgi:hypothetical protein
MIEWIKVKLEEMVHVRPHRDISMAVTKLEEAILWLAKCECDRFKVERLEEDEDDRRHHRREEEIEEEEDDDDDDEDDDDDDEEDDDDRPRVRHRRRRRRDDDDDEPSVEPFGTDEDRDRNRDRDRDADRGREYKSRAEVHAYKIRSVVHVGPNTRLDFFDPMYPSKTFTPSELIGKPVPQVGWHFVVPEDGSPFTFLSPDQFEDKYKKGS